MGRFDKNFLGGGDDFGSIGDVETADVEPVEKRFSANKKQPKINLPVYRAYIQAFK